LYTKAYLSSLNQQLALLAKGLRDPRKDIADSWMRLDELHGWLLKLIDLTIKEHQKNLRGENRALLLYSPIKLLGSLEQRIDFHRRALVLMILKRLKENRMALSHYGQRLKDLNPTLVMERGYSITRKLPEKIILRDVAGLKKGDHVGVTLAKGDLLCQIEKITRPRKKRNIH
jgi:exodeoxyribonuclease VII large subunit